MYQVDLTHKKLIGNDFYIAPNEDKRSFILFKGDELSLIDCKSEIILSSGQTLAPERLLFDFAAQIKIIFEFKDNIYLEHIISFEQATNFFVFKTQLRNDSEQHINIDKIQILRSEFIETKNIKYDRVYAQGMDMRDFALVYPLGSEYCSHMCLGLTDQQGNNALLAGFIKPVETLYDIYVDSDIFDITEFKAVCYREGTPLYKGTALEISDLILTFGSGLYDLLLTYADTAARECNAEFKTKILTGWNSWYRYYSNDTQETIIENMDILNQSHLKEHLDVIFIDDGWNYMNKGGKEWGDWYPGVKYHQNINQLVNKIKESGYQAGIWLAPFMASTNSDIYKDHPEWILKQKKGNGELVEAGLSDRKCLDLTHPEVLNFLKETFHRVYHEWNFDWVKLDFIQVAVQRGLNYNQDITTMEAYRNAMQVIKEAGGKDKNVLLCAAAFGPSIGLCDSMRVGLDTGNRWYMPVVKRVLPAGNLNIKAALMPVIWRLWMHNKFWQNDADCIITRSFKAEEEANFFKWAYIPSVLNDWDVAGLKDEEAGLLVRLVWLTGNASVLSEKLDDLSDDRLKLLEQCFPLNKQAVKWIDNYQDFELGLLMTAGDKLIAGIFNFGDQEKLVNIPAAKLGLRDKWQFTERISKDTFQGEGNAVKFPSIPPHAGRIWELN